MTAKQPKRERACEGCGTVYTIKNARSRYCSGVCRLRAWSAARPGYMAAAQKRYMAADPERTARKQVYQQRYNERPEVIARRNEINRRRYEANRDVFRARSEAHYRHIFRFLSAVKTTCGCVDCGRQDGSLHFDHRPGTTKLFNPSMGRSFVRVVEEIEKCDVRCASCHARRHERVKRERAA